MYQSQRNKLLKALKPGFWRSLPALSRLSGSLNVAGRVSELRNYAGLNIQNRCTQKGRKIHSFYRLVP